MLDTFDCVAAALLPGGVFIGRVPNAASPLGGGSQHGDFTHETAFTGRSIRQLAAAAGFRSLAIRPCAPVADGLLGPAGWPCGSRSARCSGWPWSPKPGCSAATS